MTIRAERSSPIEVQLEGLEGRRLLSASPEPAGFVLAPLAPREGRVPAVTAGRDAGAGLAVVPVDSGYGSLWGMDKIRAPLAWDRTTGGTGVVVADVDSGIDYTHRDLYRNVWLNQGEIPPTIRAGLVESPTDGDELVTFGDLNERDAAGSFVNARFVADLNSNGYIDAGDLLTDASGWEDGVDNDQNQGAGGRAYVDDLVGWNYATNTNNPYDGGTANKGHGTHTAGTIGATANDGGVVGVNWTTQVMSLKIFADDKTGVSEAALADAIRYTADNGAKVSNNSWGGTGGVTGDLLYNAIKYAGDKGQLFVAAAGNGDLFGRPINNDTSSSRTYPASYDLPNILSVAATDNADALASFSNYGATTVDLGAPGVNVLSTVPTLADGDGVKDGYMSHSGTSMAAPHVTGVAALAYNLLGAGATWQGVRDAILTGVDAAASLAGKTVTGGRLNAFRTVEFANPTPVSAPVLNSATGVSSSRIDLSWTDTSDNENGFLVQRWDAVAQAFVTVKDVAANQTSHADTGLAAGQSYAYRVVAYNNHPDRGVSNEVVGTTRPGAYIAAPSKLSAAANSATQINLTWADNSDNETGFSVERYDGFGFVVVGTVGANATSWADAGRTASTDYSYRVRATDATAGTYSEYSDVDTERTFGTGTGLVGKYYDSTSQSWNTPPSEAQAFGGTPKLTRTDAQVNFNWGTGSPATQIKSKDTFAVRWTGQLETRYGEDYTFHVEADDGFRVWIDGQLVSGWQDAAGQPLANSWKTQWYKGTSGGRFLAAGKHAIQIDYYDNAQGAVMKLEWSSASQARQFIPKSQLYTTSAAPIYTASLAAVEPAAAPAPVFSRVSIAAEGAEEQAGDVLA